VRRIFISIIMIICSIAGVAQTDPHFSQYYHFTPAINPAMTGIMNGSLRLSAIYRNQWNAVMLPYETPGIQVEASTNRNFNLGVSFMNQKAGDGGFRYTQGQLNMNYTGIQFGNSTRHHIAIGIQAAFIQRSFEPSKLRLGDQWIPGVGYNPGLNSNDVFPVRNSIVPDISAGIFYFADAEEQTILPFAGLAVYHLNQPADPFVTTKDLPYIPMRFSMQAGMLIKANETTNITTHLLYMQQGVAFSIIPGLQAKFYINDETAFLTGIYYRSKDSFTPFVGLEYKKFVVGASYDITSSDLSRSVNGTGTTEISLSFMFDRRTPKSNYRFECPRL